MPRHRRTRARGAALVETVAVIPIFILFFIGMIYFFNLYSQKMTAQSLARSHTMGYALGGCQGDFRTVVHANTGDLATAPPSGVGDPSSTEPQDGNAQAMEQQSGFGIASLKHTASTVTGTVNVAQLPQATKNVSSQSIVMCGETPVQGDLKGLIQYAIHLFVP